MPHRVMQDSVHCWSNA